MFLTDPGLAKLHADFMDDPTTTDVITFEGDPMAELAGEIVGLPGPVGTPADLAGDEDEPPPGADRVGVALGRRPARRVDDVHAAVPVLAR